LSALNAGTATPSAADIAARVRAASSSFYWAMRLLPGERRRAIFAVYAFCRDVDDIADEPGSLAARCYGATEISERHRHRCEFNNRYRQQFTAHGLKFSGTSPDGSLVEVIELAEHPWFLAVQYHPEFKSKPTAPQPLFAGFVGAAVTHSQGKGGRAAPASHDDSAPNPRRATAAK